MSSRVRPVFDLAAPRYPEGNPLLVVERKETEALLPPLRGLRVLDLGAGPGHYAALAHRRGAGLSVALDLSGAMLRSAPAPRLVADAARLPFPDRALDLVVAALVLSHTEHPDIVLHEMARVLRPGGHAVFSDLHPVARDLGWRRTFADSRGGQVTAPGVPLAADHLRALMDAAGLAIEAWREPAIGDSLGSHFRRAGRRDFQELRGTPLLVIARLRKAGC